MSNIPILKVDKYYQQMIRWVSKISLSVLDQGLFSGSNFIVVFLLGRWLNEKEYGAYGIVFTIFLFIMGFFTALILEPMNVYGPSYFSGQLQEYKNKLLYIQLRFGLILLVTLLIITSLLYIGRAENEIIVSMVGLSMAIPMISFYWFARQACYIDTNPKIAVFGSISYAFTFLAGTISLYQMKIISGANVFLLMGFAGLIGGIVIGAKIQFEFRSLIKIRGSLEKDEILKKHWNYGKWVLGTAVANGIASLSFPIIVGLFLGLNEAGAYRAMQNLFSPLQQVMAALSLLLLPWVSRQFNKGRKHLLQKVMLGIGAVFLFISIVYLFPLNIFGKQIIAFYKKDFYQEFLWVIPFFSINSIIMAVTTIYGIVLRALERSDIVMRSKIWSAISVLTLGIFLSQQYKLFGTMMILIISVVIESIILIVWELNNAKKLLILDVE